MHLLERIGILPFAFILPASYTETALGLWAGNFSGVSRFQTLVGSFIFMPLQPGHIFRTFSLGHKELR